MFFIEGERLAISVGFFWIGGGGCVRVLLGGFAVHCDSYLEIIV